MPARTFYSNLISDKSRRLRTTGLVVLVALVLMASYGAFSLMPSVRASQKELNWRQSGLADAEFHDNIPQAKKALAAKLIFVYGYWSVCGVLTLGIFTIAWLDMREVTRQYSAERMRNLRQDLDEPLA